jgi:hypothetical protein
MEYLGAVANETESTWSKILEMLLQEGQKHQC